MLLTTHEMWRVRPADAQFKSLEDMSASISLRRAATRELEQMSVRQLLPSANNSDITLAMPSGLTMNMTHWSFDQLCKLGKAPAEYMRRLPTPLACLNLHAGLVQAEADHYTKVLFTLGADTEVRALTSVGYGRVWDADVLDALANNLGDEWTVDQGTTSDRDMYVFVVDRSRPIHVQDETLYRGLYVWNSEVGASTLGIAPYLKVGNVRLLWGADQLRIRHTAFAPERFMHEVKRTLESISAASERPIEDLVINAKATKVSDDREFLSEWLNSRHLFSKSDVKDTVARVETPCSLWDVVVAGCKFSSDIEQTDDRLAQEQRFTDLLAYRDRGHHYGVDYLDDDADNEELNEPTGQVESLAL